MITECQRRRRPPSQSPAHSTAMQLTTIHLMSFIFIPVAILLLKLGISSGNRAPLGLNRRWPIMNRLDSSISNRVSLLLNWHAMFARSVFFFFSFWGVLKRNRCPSDPAHLNNRVALSIPELTFHPDKQERWIISDNRNKNNHWGLLLWQFLALSGDNFNIQRSVFLLLLKESIKTRKVGTMRRRGGGKGGGKAKKEREREREREQIPFHFIINSILSFKIDFPPSIRGAFSD